MIDDDDNSTFSIMTTPPSTQVVIMEGMLKIRGHGVPMMRDRYCVATWEGEVDTAKAVVLRTYKTQAAYVQKPDKPASEYTLKCLSDWDGKGKLRTYSNGFIFETNEQKLFHCVAPSEEEKDKWTELMDTVVTPRTVVEEPVIQPKKKVRPPSEGFVFEDRSVDVHGFADPDDIGDAEDLFGDDDVGGLESMMNANDVKVMKLAAEDDDKLLFRSSSGSLTVSDLDQQDDRRTRLQSSQMVEEPADWGLYGESDDIGNGPSSRYDVVDNPVVLLDNDILSGTSKAPALSSDAFLFEENGPTFGAVVVNRLADDDADDFVDPELVARQEKKKKEKQLKRVVQKLESNRDLYAEMAAARLRSMRKDARHPRRSVSHRRDNWSEFDDDEYDESHAGYDGDFGSFRSSRSLAESTTPSVAHSGSIVESVEVDDEDEEARRKRERRALRKMRRQEAESADTTESNSSDLAMVTFEAAEHEEDDGFLFGDAGVPMRPSSVITEETTGITGEDEVRARKREKKNKKRREEVVQDDEESVVKSAPYESNGRAERADSELTAEELEEERRREKQRRKEERRARREKERRAEEEAAAAAELARQHREEMRRQEEERYKHDRHERKEKKKSKEKSSLEKKAKELKKREAALQAEAERLKQAEEELKAEAERKDRKTKRRDKYTSPTERIQRREKEAEALASEMSNALVLVETPPQTAPAAMQAPVTVSVASVPTEVAPAPVSTPAVPVATSPEAQTMPQASVPVETTAPAPHSAPAIHTTAPGSIPPAPQSVPMQMPMMAPPSFYPGYPPAMMPQYQPYPAAYPAMPYGAAYPPMQYAPVAPAYYQPPVGYVPGAYPPTMTPPVSGAMFPPGSIPTGPTAEEEPPAFIGPSLPSPKAHQDGPPPPPPPSTSSVAPPSSTASILPDLPDIVGF